MNVILADARKVSPLAFFRSVIGKPCPYDGIECPDFRRRMDRAWLMLSKRPIDLDAPHWAGHDLNLAPVFRISATEVGV